MGVELTAMASYYEYGKNFEYRQFPKQVLDLACRVLKPVISDHPVPVSHLVVATTCPDSMAPSLGQEINKFFHPFFRDTHVIDIVQGCAGGVSALLLGSQLAAYHGKPVMVVIADAAKKACDPGSKSYDIFGNGSFACLMSPGNTFKGLLHFKSRQYPELTDVVSVKLGHDADAVLKAEKDVPDNPRKYLGLQMDSGLAIELMIKAKSFYDEFIDEIKMEPDILILHQVNPKIISYLEKTFGKKGLHFVNVSETAGNCGAASVGIALKNEEKSLEGKRVGICSFGTGGVITAGFWQC